MGAPAGSAISPSGSNTPDDFPTFPEAIQDTLTKRARDLLRVLRVRPFIHDRFKSKTPLLALEPIARNIAVRRSRPSNRWILHKLGAQARSATIGPGSSILRKRPTFGLIGHAVAVRAAIENCAR
jgi:hypothetical protein